MTRQTRRADQLEQDDLVVWRGAQLGEPALGLITHTQPAPNPADVFVIDSLTRTVVVPGDRLFELATPAEMKRFDDQQIRARVVAGLRNLAGLIAERRLPVPLPSDVVVAFDLDDEDLPPWIEALGCDPVRPEGSRRPVIRSERPGVSVEVYGREVDGPVGGLPPALAAGTPSYDPHPTLLVRPGGTRDAAMADYARSLDESNPGWHWDRVDRMDPGLAAEAERRRAAEQRDAVGAFPVVAQPAAYGIDREGGRWYAAGHVSWQSSALGKRITCTTDEVINRYGPVAWFDANNREIDGGPGYDPVRGRGEKPKPAPDGWPISDGHRPTPPAEAMEYDRHGNGKADR